MGGIYAPNFRHRLLATEYMGGGSSAGQGVGVTVLRQRNLFLEEPGLVVITNVFVGWVSTLAVRWHVISGSGQWTLAAVLVFVALTAITVASAWRFEGKWTRGFWGLLASYESIAVVAALWWWAQGR
jgi:hypothetical protein